jgi:hypothetical protein
MQIFSVGRGNWKTEKGRCKWCIFLYGFSILEMHFLRVFRFEGRKMHLANTY